jgi:hypothetical protein
MTLLTPCWRKKIANDFMSEEQNTPETGEQSQQQASANADAAQVINQILSNIDFDKVTKDDVVSDIMQNSRLFAIRLMVGAAVLEQIIVREKAKDDGEDAQPSDSPEESSVAADEPIQDQPDLAVVPDEEAK